MDIPIKMERVVPFVEHHYQIDSMPQCSMASVLSAASIPNHDVQRRVSNLDTFWLSG